VRCYRCTPQIVDVANSVIHAGTGKPITLTSQCAPGPVPEVTAFDDDVAEARAIAESIAAEIDAGAAPSDFAVLYRINAQSVEIAAALAERGIPFTTRGSERFFELPEVREAVTRIRGAARAGETSLEAVPAILGAMGWTPEVPTSTGAVRDRWENLSAIVALSREQSSVLADFVTELDRRAEMQHSPEAVGVTLASIHAAKGLEWPVVFVLGCSDGLLPLLHAESPEQIEEERRLLYVAITRAQRRLSLSWAHAREPGSRAVRVVSRFLQGLQAVPGSSPRGQVSRGAPAKSRTRRGPATCRTCGRALVTATERTVGRCRVCPATYRDQDFEQLRAWRLDRATADGVPAYVVFTDATLIAICETQPGSLEELARIPGIGPAKLTAYGDDVLALVSSW
jgi:DNA helicase-2/ATP-dependent DNA helicase PcrA